MMETILRYLGGLLAYITLGILVIGIWRGTRRRVGRTTGLDGSWLHSPWFYLVSVVLFFSICLFGWRPLPWMIPKSLHSWFLALGSVLLFPGMLFLLWGRLTLGKNYFVSTGFGAQLFEGHELVTGGPFAIVRHPMYVGLILAALGSLLLYFTWTTLVFAIFAPMVIVRAHREESTLAAEFGEEWREYCMRVPAFLPRIHR